MNRINSIKKEEENKSLIINYFIKLDIESIPVFNKNYDLLNNIYKEIELNPQQIFLNENCKINLEFLILKSNLKQINKLIKNIRDPIFCIKKFIGSKIYELILNKVLNLISKNIYDKEIQKIIKTFYNQFIKNKVLLKELINNKISTFPIRLYFIIINKMLIKYDNKLIKEDLLKEEFLEDLIKEEEEKYKEGFYSTFLELLKLYNEEIKQNIINKLINKLKFNQNILENKTYSYFYESIIKYSNQENLNLFYKIIKPNLIYFIKHENVNYIISEFAKRNLKISNILFDILIENKINENSNIYISLLINSLKNNNEILINKIFNKILPENYFDLFIIEGSINKKYLEVFCLLIYLKRIDNLIEKFKLNFQFFWLETEKGLKICKAIIQTYPEIINFIFNKLKERKLKKNEFTNKLLNELKKFGDKKMLLFLNKNY